MIKKIYKLNLYVDGKKYDRLPPGAFNVLDLKTNIYMEAQPLKGAKYCIVDLPLIDENKTYRKVIDTRFVSICATNVGGDLNGYGFVKDKMVQEVDGVYIIWKNMGVIN